MLKVSIIGASGYSGAELAKLVAKHPAFTLAHCFVSEQSLDKHKFISDLYPEYSGLLDIELQPLNEQAFSLIEQSSDYVCLCTDHKVSVELAPVFLQMGKRVFDLSGGYRLSSNEDYETYYGFSHPHQDWLAQAQYGLAEWYGDAIKTAKLVAVAGCYPTAALNALKPLQQADLITEQPVIINAVSGVTGAGRKANVATHFCEVSLAPYGLFTHRHSPEIEKYLEHPVLFTPHLGNFKRGILETIYVTLKENVTPNQVDAAYQVLADEPLIRLKGSQLPSIKAVENQPFVDIGWQQKGNQLIVVVAIDNLLKGAAGQALQCMNLAAGLEHYQGLGVSA
ncbi:N-acetyl-gamma-glutamyl-phosphate reductase [Pseudoalteromonas piscicida]|uniref:N-acetyl-gamma-glutamyl-phosphate reductase n=1 Tax=Pseudoalteromonas piscicida TaxID=43662 RepID=A0AAD0RIM0_PSEO7|nr:N-acetyl-gamma-glutamyl-phosphate reductase [Pseudoalteromonas piscicida]ODB37234.1 N-acetyl-gamma-glutamyl-phosphate reductase [Pseudoalteromonas sp. BMB]USE70520.1 N-acetyl-gamma-glutamyl-phosphate reductase [Pseudoalteromonas flavipulchra]AXQ96744.1 N-acetyl-gamma-glutamyl-phosphate reductase [Pseudoalteromonas piscicida]AXR03492.1 N-acetyl-gamma-glutamyl-phosphate reductase [Pseudoalteromonas piscicida]